VLISHIYIFILLFFLKNRQDQFIYSIHLFICNLVKARCFYCIGCLAHSIFLEKKERLFITQKIIITLCNNLLDTDSHCQTFWPQPLLHYPPPTAHQVIPNAHCGAIDARAEVGARVEADTGSRMEATKAGCPGRRTSQRFFLG
jgi:hypothetical protein